MNQRPNRPGSNPTEGAESRPTRAQRDRRPTVGTKSNQAANMPKALAAEDGDGAVDANVARDIAQVERHAFFQRIVNREIAAPVRAVRARKAAR